MIYYSYLHLRCDCEDAEEEKDGHFRGIGEHVHRRPDRRARGFRHVLNKTGFLLID
jgi:hypothetical protein